MAVAPFVYADWSAAFPELSGVTSATATAKFGQAGLYLSNTDTSPVQDIPTRTTLLYLITAHLAQLGRTDVTGGLANPLVGRISNAGEGSVSVGVDVGPVTNSTQAFFYQTTYGMQYWAATAGLRLGRYVPARPTALGFGVSRAYR